MSTIAVLGPEGTFSLVACKELVARFGSPWIDQTTRTILATKNEEVLPLVLRHGGYGVLAMETDAEGRIETNLKPFFKLLDREDSPINVVGAIRLPVNFVLMARPGVHLGDITTVLAHSKAIGACKRRLETLGVATQLSDSNAKAAEDVATKEEYARHAALGPRIAAETYGLTVLVEGFEDSPAVTTFFLISPKVHEPKASAVNRSLLVFRTQDEVGVLAKILLAFAETGLNLRQIHSCYVEKGQYDFLIEIDCVQAQVDAHKRATAEASKYMVRHVLLGPFPVL